MAQILSSRLVSIPWTDVRSPGATQPDTVHTLWAFPLSLTIGLKIDRSLYAVGGVCNAHFYVRTPDYQVVSDYLVSARLSDLAGAGSLQPILYLAYSNPLTAGIRNPGVYLFRPVITIVADAVPTSPDTAAEAQVGGGLWLGSGDYGKSGASGLSLQIAPDDWTQFAVAEEHYFVVGDQWREPPLEGPQPG